MAYQGNIALNHFGKLYGQGIEEEEKIKRQVTACVKDICGDIKAQRIEFYNMDDNEKHCYEAGSNERLLIFCNTTNVNVEGDKIEFEDKVKMDECGLNFKKFYKPLKNDDTVVLSEDGKQIAEYFPELNQVNILFDLFEKHSDDMYVAVSYIMKKINNLILEIQERSLLWGRKENEERLAKAFEDAVMDSRKRRLAEDIERIKITERDIESYKRNLTSLIRKRDTLIVTTEAAKNNEKDNMASIIQDFNLIIQHKKVTKLAIENKKITVSTVPLYITSDRGKRYYGGNYRIEINMENSDVRFFGDNPRRSYWTEKDPHPHVCGTDGHACLGNIAETIAELCAGFQVYALAMICIDFLESANTADAAGKKVINWDEVDENNNVIGKKVVLKKCERCRDEFTDDELCVVYNDINGNGVPVGEHLVCEDCRDEDYEYDDEHDVFVRN